MISALPRSLFALALAPGVLLAADDYVGTLKPPESSLSPKGVYSFSTPASVAAPISFTGENGYRFKLGYKYSRYLAVEGEFVDFGRAPRPLLKPRQPRLGLPQHRFRRGYRRHAAAVALLVLRPHGRLPGRWARRFRLWLHGAAAGQRVLARHPRALRHGGPLRLHPLPGHARGIRAPLARGAELPRLGNRRSRPVLGRGVAGASRPSSGSSPTSGELALAS